MLKKKVNGAWTAVRDVKKKVNGVWSDCTKVFRQTSSTWIWSWWWKQTTWAQTYATLEYDFASSKMTKTQTTATITVSTPKTEGSYKLSTETYYTSGSISLKKGETLYIEYTFTPSHVYGAYGFIQLSCYAGLGSMSAGGDGSQIANATINSGTGTAKLTNTHENSDVWQIWVSFACSQQAYAPAYNATLEIKRIYSEHNVYYWS